MENEYQKTNINTKAQLRISIRKNTQKNDKKEYSYPK